MNARLNETHDKDLTSWVDGANGHPDFPIQNLPFGVGAREGEAHCYVAIGDMALDLTSLDEWDYFAEPELNTFMAAGRDVWRAVRVRLSELLSDDANKDRLAPYLHPQNTVQMQMPARVGDYSDFFTSYHHAINCGHINRPDNPLSPSFWHMPIGYHGRASTVVVSGTDVRRPLVQLPNADLIPRHDYSQMLDYEGELGVFIGGGNKVGEPIPLAEIEDHLFGVVILNDWTSRDTQVWEKRGSGPLLGKNFLTSISPWIVTMEALAPFRYAHERPDGTPPVLPYLTDQTDQETGALDIVVDVSLQTAKSNEPERISRASLRPQAFTVGQIVTHHASNGCRLRPGDIIATGTISNEGEDGRGCLLEKTRRGREPITLSTGERRSFLEDGDTVVMTAHCTRDGFARIGFGTCAGQVLNTPQSDET